MPWPTFLIIGAPRSGTTSLHRYLRRHPDVFLPHLKEPRFFALDGQAIPWQGPGDQRIYGGSVTDQDTYHALFDEVGKATILGEASSLYLYEPGTAERIHHHQPEMRLIAVLRDPAERAYSAYLSMVRQGLEPLSFTDALDAEAGRIEQGWSSSWHYTRVGCYTEQLNRYRAVFPHEHLRIYLFDDLVADTTAVVRDILAFVGADASILPDVSIRYNKSGVPKSRALHRLLREPNAVRAVLRRILPLPLKRRIANGRLVQSVRSRNLDQPAMPSDARHRLHAFYQDEIPRLETLLGRDLSHWLAEG